MQATSDRADILDKAARSLSRGDLDAALRLYLRVFDDDPQDWSVGNTLGDLYTRMGKADAAVAHFAMLAEQLAADGFAAKARALYRKIVRLQPGNEDARRRVAELDRQQVGETSPFLKRVLETARTQREAGVVDVAPPAAVPVAPAPAAPPIVAAPPPIAVAPPPPIAVAPPPIAVAPPPPMAAAPAPMQAAPDRRAETAAEEVTPFSQMEHAAAAAAARHDYGAAAAIVERFLEQDPLHVPALERLIDISVDGERTEELTAAQQRLADACVRTGHYRQAFDAAVDLYAREPRVGAHRERLDDIVGVSRVNGCMFVVPPLMTEPEPFIASVQPVPPAAPRPLSVPGPRAVPEPSQPVSPRAPAPMPAPPESEPLPPAAAQTGGAVAIGPPFGALLKEWGDPERALEETRNALLEDGAAAAEEGYVQALRLIDARQFGDAIRPLEDAMCLPHLRAPAGSQLARVYRDTGAPANALSVLESVVELPPADEASAHELAYELARTLEALGQQAQALGVYRELLAEVGSTYRDVATRVQRLAAA